MVYDCIIVGGGAAGLAAAVFLGQAAQDRSVLLLEKQPRVGKKLLATGNGTCNVSNMQAGKSGYHGDPALAKAALNAFPVDRTMDFFNRIGVDLTVREDGKMYPQSEQAGAVLDALRLEAEACGVELRCEQTVQKLTPCKEGWRAVTQTDTYTARQVLVAVGGAAAPSLGGSADGYRLLTDLGLTKTPLFPSIVQVRTATDFVRAVKGIRVDGTVRLLLDGRELARQTGEILFTDYGLSGPAVMAVSRVAADWERQKKGKLIAELDLLPVWAFETLCHRIRERSRLKGRTMEDLLTGLLHKRVGQTVLRVAGVLPLTREASTLTAKECEAVAATIKAWRLEVTGTQGFGGAQVTAGGIDTAQLDPATMGCQGHPGLYAVGEVLNVDGDCGGYNLQFAWSSAYVAAKAIAAQW